MEKSVSREEAEAPNGEQNRIHEDSDSSSGKCEARTRTAE